MTNEEIITKVALNFDLDCTPIEATNYGCGHINDTYLIKTDTEKKFILQRINNNVFKNVDALMQNIKGVTEYIAKGNKDLPEEELLKVIPTKTGGDYFEADGLYFRMYNFISAGISLETTPDEASFYLCGKGFGKFQNQLNGYPSNTLFESIPDFHNTEKRFEAFEDAIAQNLSGRIEMCLPEIEFFLSRDKYATPVVEMLENGKLPLRVTHNDTKMNNVLINLKEKRASAVIDLDTVMPGSILYDFGDSIRSGANMGAEDEKDLSKVGFSSKLFLAYSKGFLEEVGKSLTELEKKLLPFGAILMTYECGMRFLTDFLNGDTYFRTKYPEHNLVRTRTQMKMVEDMEKAFHITPINLKNNF